MTGATHRDPAASNAAQASCPSTWFTPNPGGVSATEGGISFRTGHVDIEGARVTKRDVLKGDLKKATNKGLEPKL